MKKFNCVLLVDDDQVSNFLHKEVLEGMHIADHMHESRNGYEALSFVKEHCIPVQESECPDLILLDIKMPVMNGFEFLEELDAFKNELNRNFKIVIVSSSTNPNDREQSQKFSIDGYIDKPLSASKLEQIVN
ncbi:response regulator [Halocola ammonii]